MVLNGPLTGCSWRPQRHILLSLARKSRALTSPHCKAGKGFGQPAPGKPQEEGSGDLPSSKMKRVKSKGKQQRRLPQPSQPPAQQTMVQEGGSNLDADSAPTSLVSEMEFEERLKALKQEAEQKKLELKAAGGPGAGGILDAKRKEQDNIYANPPPLSQTLFGGEKKESDAEYEGSSFGPGQVALGAVSLALVGVFVLASGSDYAPTRSSPSSQQEQQQAAQVDLGEDTRKELEARLAEFTAQLAQDPGSSEALEGAAVVNARLGNYKEAVEQLQQLTAAKPGDPSVWRVLAESQAATGDRKAALASYQRAWQEVKAGPEGVGAGLEVVQGLAGELVAAGQEQQAVEVVKEAQGLVASTAGTGSSDSAGQQQQQQQLGPVEAQLLLAKVYSQWRGHTSEAFAVYEQVTQEWPEDFRGFLGKGLLLREQGRQADAQRAFIQARYLAPKETRPVVDAIIASRTS